MSSERVECFSMRSDGSDPSGKKCDGLHITRKKMNERVGRLFAWEINRYSNAKWHTHFAPFRMTKLITSIKHGVVSRTTGHLLSCHRAKFRFLITAVPLQMINEWKHVGETGTDESRENVDIHYFYFCGYSDGTKKEFSLVLQWKIQFVDQLCLLTANALRKRRLMLPETTAGCWNSIPLSLRVNEEYLLCCARDQVNVHIHCLICSISLSECIRKSIHVWCLYK